MKILLFGTFDHLHPGHAFVLSEAVRRGHVTVIVARDGNVERIKGRAPSQPEEERARVLREAFPGVTVALGDRRDFLVPVRRIAPRRWLKK